MVSTRRSPPTRFTVEADGLAGVVATDEWWCGDMNYRGLGGRTRCIWWTAAGPAPFDRFGKLVTFCLYSFMRTTLRWSLSTCSVLYRGKNISINTQRNSKTQRFWKTLIFSRILGHFPATTTASTRICRNISAKHHAFGLLQTHQRSGKFQTRQFF